MGIIYSFLSICVLGFSLLQGIVGLVSYRRVEKNKLLFVSLAFFTFAVKGAYSLVVEYSSFTLLGKPNTFMLLLDLLIVILLYLSILKE